MHELNVKAMSIGMGVCWSLAMIGLGTIARFGWCNEMAKLFGSIYLGFKTTIKGIIIGGLWDLLMELFQAPLLHLFTIFSYEYN